MKEAVNKENYTEFLQLDELKALATIDPPLVSAFYSSNRYLYF